MATYVEKTLAGNEKILYVAHFNWTYSFFPVLWFAIGLAPLIMYLSLMFGSNLSASDLGAGWWIAAFGACVGSIILLNQLIFLATTDIAVTSYRFVFKKGLISRNAQEVSLTNIEEITLKQTFWGRLFNYGHLTIHGTGVGVIKLPSIDHPIKLRKAIEQAKFAMSRGGGQSAHHAQPSSAEVSASTQAQSSDA
ncbi:MAG: PH domain-containing protein [Alphaproteobacteria bacterium]|nr:PH domain-containing protein [Alphaproteobacteria bacterium]